MSGVGDADAYEVKKTTRGELVHWERATVEYTIDPSVEHAVSHATAATTRAMESWSGTVGAPELVFAEEGENSPTEPAFDQKNGVFFMKSGYAPAGRALAITVLTYDNVTGHIIDADVIFNGAYSFKVLAAPAIQAVAKESATAKYSSNTDGIEHEQMVTVEQSHDTVYDLHHVIAHELGHSLGMNDEMGRSDALMYRYSAPNDASLRAPAPDDIAGLAELYSTTLDARGNGCGSATVAPNKPSRVASQVALLGTLGLLLFIVLRTKSARARSAGTSLASELASDRRHGVAFVVAATAVMVGFVPILSGKSGPGIAAASERRQLGHARAKVLQTSTAIERGLFKTNYELATTTCRAASCPKSAHGVAWGGTIGNITQDVGGYFAPANGDDVDVSFSSLPDALGPLKNPLVGRFAAAMANGDVSVLTRAN